jgi:AraC-like DNA-binding protein
MTVNLLYWDGLMRGGAMALLLLLAIFFIRDVRSSLTARLGLTLALAGVSFLITLALPASFFRSWWRVPIQVVNLATPGLFWLFMESWFRDDFELSWSHGFAVLVLVLPGTFQQSGLFIPFSGDLASLAGLVAVALGLRAAILGRTGDLVESRRRARIMLSMVIGVIIMAVTLAELPLRHWPPSPLWRLENATLLFMLAATVTISLLGWRDPSVIAPPATLASAPAPAALREDEALLTSVDKLMRGERLYRQERLTVSAVAARLCVPDYRLRRAINQGAGARNFNAFLNQYRLDEAKAALMDPAQRDVPILTIALDAGFGSPAPFNRAFKEATGLTPTEFRARGGRAPR